MLFRNEEAMRRRRADSDRAAVLAESQAKLAALEVRVCLLHSLRMGLVHLCINSIIQRVSLLASLYVCSRPRHAYRHHAARSPRLRVSMSPYCEVIVH